MNIEVTAEEKRSGQMSDETVARAADAVRTEGYVVIEDVVDHDHLDVLKTRMDEDAERKIRSVRWGGAGAVQGHLQHKPPPFAPYVFGDVVANGFVGQVTHAVLGDGVYNRFYSGNTNCPGSGTQPVHPDHLPLWAGLEQAHPAYQLVVNISPENTSEKNGAVEIWPGTHLVMVEPDYSRTATERFQKEVIEARREEVPPIRGSAKKGSVLIRDIRLWHRGVPNPSDSPRHMIALIHTIHWYGKGEALKFERGCEDAFPENGPVDPNVEFVDELIDYMNNPRP